MNDDHSITDGPSIKHKYFRQSMKKVIILLALFTACNTPKENKKDESTIDSAKSDKITPQKSIEYNLGGVWLNKKYIEKLQQTGSPRIAQDAVTMSMIILPDNLN